MFYSCQSEAGNSDGRRFMSADGQTVLSAYASYNALDGDPAADRKIARESWQEKHATITLDQPTRTGYVLSGQVKGRIFYEKTVLKSNTLTTLSMGVPGCLEGRDGRRHSAHHPDAATQRGGRQLGPLPYSYSNLFGPLCNFLPCAT